MADDDDRTEEEREKAKLRTEARRRAKAPKEKPHPKKGYTTHATDSKPRAAGRSTHGKKTASEGEQGAHAGRGRPPED